MKDLTEYLKKVKIKEIGFDITDEESCLKAVRKYGYLIQFIKNPSEAVCLAALNQNGYSIHYIENPSEEVCLAAVKQNGNLIRYIDIDSLSEATKEILVYLV